MRRVAVTGATGRVGRTLIAQLQSDGDEVIPIDIKENGVPGTILLDLNDPAGIEPALENVEIVVHLAAYMSWDPSVAGEVLHTNVISTYNILAAALNCGVRRVVIASTGEVYPENSPQYLPVDENHPTLPRTVYGLSKLLAEEVAGYFARTSALEVVILRFSHTQDAAELASPRSPMSGPRFFLKAKAAQQAAFGNTDFAKHLEELDSGQNGMYIATDAQGKPFRMGICETRDLVSGIKLGMDTPGLSGQTIGIGAPKASSFDEIVRPISEALGLPATFVQMPGQPVNYETSNSKALEVMGYRPEWTIERMIDAAIVAAKTEGK